MAMSRNTKDNILMAIVGFVFFLNILMLNNLLTTIDPMVEELIILGWVLLGTGALLVGASVFTLMRKGTANLVEGGVYSIVRHPMYVGGMVMFASHFFFGQSIPMGISSALAVYCCYLLIQSEDQQISEKFGDQYRSYARKVPKMNFLIGVGRRLRPKASS